MLNYSFSVTWSDEDEGYIAICPEFSGLSAFGDTAEEAITELKVAIGLATETYQAEGWDIPQPRQLPEYSGKLLLRMPKSLHGKLAQQAEVEGVSLNTFVVTLLSDAMGAIAGIARVERVVTRTLRQWNATFVRTVSAVVQSQRAESGTVTLQIGENYQAKTPKASARATSFHLQ